MRGFFNKENLETTVVNSHNLSARSRSRKGRSIGSMHEGCNSLKLFYLSKKKTLTLLSHNQGWAVLCINNFYRKLSRHLKAFLKNSDCNSVKYPSTKPSLYHTRMAFIFLVLSSANTSKSSKYLELNAVSPK